MSNKNKNKNGIVYSTNPDFQYEYINETEEQETLEPGKQKLYLSLDRKQRNGKQVTVIENFIGKEKDFRNLEKLIKTKCSVGGTCKDYQIILQGDVRNKVEKILLELGYKVIRIGS